MSKSQRKQIVYCLQHEFNLAPLKGDTYLKQTVTLSYCKGKNEAKNKGQNKKNKLQQNCSCCPVFNKDKNHATSSFILPEEQQNFIENSQKFKLEHDCRVCDYNDEKSKMLVPKPKTRYSYCNACRTNYDDYLQHIENQSHKSNINKSKFSSYIKDLENKYEGKERIKKNSRKPIQVTSVTTHNVEQSNVNIEQMGRPSKKVKISQDNFNQLPNSAKTMASYLSSMPMNQYGANYFYAGIPYGQFPRFQQQPIQMFHPSFTGMNPYTYQIECGMYGAPPCFCWSAYHTMYGGMNYNQNKPLVIDLQAKQE